MKLWSMEGRVYGLAVCEDRGIKCRVWDVIRRMDSC